MRSWIRSSFIAVFTGLFLIACQPADTVYVPLAIQTRQGVRAFKIEMATTDEQRERGLMFRESLASDHGMLFIFDTPQTVNFWMKNTLIPLDIVFIKGNGTISHIHRMAVPHDESLISSGEPVKMVLEIAGGQADKQGIGVGDTILFEGMK